MSIDAKTARETAANSEAYKKNMETIYSGISEAASKGKFHVDISSPSSLFSSKVLAELEGKGFVVKRLVVGLEDLFGPALFAPTLSKKAEYRISWSNA